ncbi:RNA polymerase II transcription factor B 52 kDa subunit [Lecanora helva]
MSVSSLRSFEYLEGLPGTTFNRLYKQPSTALAIFRRMLSHLAKSFVMALLYISHPMPVTDLEAWVRPDGKRERDHAINLLERLHILTTTANPGKPRAYALTNPFAASLRLALTGGGGHKSFGVPLNDSQGNQVNVAELDNYARNQWEGVLGYMVGSTGVGIAGSAVEPSDGVKTILQWGNLVVVRGRKVEITKEGFAFILQEVNAQVWTILVLYLQNAPELGMDEVDVLSFLFMLGSLELGLSYSKANLTPTQTQMLQDLGDFGIVYTPSDSGCFYPTRLATTLTSDAGGLRSSTFASSSSANSGFIVIETNYRIYAYTNSNLQIAIIGLFTRLNTQYPNMVAGKITRESIRRAVSMGITSDQIISFLTSHAHPQMVKNQTILPPTVVDQIRLWQLEGDRMKATVGFLFKEFNTQPEFEGVCRYAEEIGVLIWKNESQRKFFVTRHEQVAAYLRNKRTQ